MAMRMSLLFGRYFFALRVDTKKPLEFDVTLSMSRFFVFKLIISSEQMIEATQS